MTIAKSTLVGAAMILSALIVTPVNATESSSQAFQTTVFSVDASIDGQAPALLTDVRYKSRRAYRGGRQFNHHRGFRHRGYRSNSYYGHRKFHRGHRSKLHHKKKHFKHGSHHSHDRFHHKRKVSKKHRRW